MYYSNNILTMIIKKFIIGFKKTFIKSVLNSYFVIHLYSFCEPVCVAFSADACVSVSCALYKQDSCTQKQVYLF